MEGGALDDFHPTGEAEDFKEISVGRNAQYVVKVSPEDYDYLIGFRWTFKQSDKRYGQAIYARRNQQCGRGKERKLKPLYMHVVILERMGQPKPSDPMITADHRNGETLDNRRSNLRWLGKKGQAANRRKRK